MPHKLYIYFATRIHKILLRLSIIVHQIVDLDVHSFAAKTLLSRKISQDHAAHQGRRHPYKVILVGTPGVVRPMLFAYLGHFDWVNVF